MGLVSQRTVTIGLIGALLTIGLLSSAIFGAAAATGCGPSGYDPCNPPGAPTDVTATPGSGQATVDFSEPVNDGGKPILDYTVTCGIQSTTGTGLSLIVTGLAPGVPVECTVKARNEVGTGPASSPPVSVTPSGTAPGAPTGVKVGASASGTANVSFGPPLDPGSSPVTAYQASCGGVTKGRVGSPIEVTGLPNGVATTCKVRARNAAGFGPFSAEVPFVPGVPWGPTSVSGGPGPVTGSVVVSWNAAQTNGAPITSYVVTCTPWSPTFPTRSVSVGGAKRAAQVNGLQTNAQHTCSIVASNSRGPGNPRVATPVGTIKPKS